MIFGEKVQLVTGFLFLRFRVLQVGIVSPVIFESFQQQYHQEQVALNEQFQVHVQTI